MNYVYAASIVLGGIAAFLILIACEAIFEIVCIVGTICLIGVLIYEIAQWIG